MIIFKLRKWKSKLEIGHFLSNFVFRQTVCANILLSGIAYKADLALIKMPVSAIPLKFISELMNLQLQQACIYVTTNVLAYYPQLIKGCVISVAELSLATFLFRGWLTIPSKGDGPRKNLGSSWMCEPSSGLNFISKFLFYKPEVSYPTCSKLLCFLEYINVFKD